jgi:large subunit ribosomal protein L10
MAFVAQHKKDKVNAFTKLIEEYPIIGSINMQNLPTKQLQNMRAKLRGGVLLKMTKRRLLNIALANSKKPGIEQLKDHLKGMPALLFTKDNPFALFSTLKKNKSKAPISAGQVAPNDIVVPAGKTSFAPGPIIGELGSFGIITGVEGGKIAIKTDKIVAREGEVVNSKLAGLLQRLDIQPMEVGLDLVAVYENGEILTKEILNVDEDEYRNNFITAAKEAFNLAFNSAYPTTETITLLIQKAAANSRALALEANILTNENVGIFLSKAENQAEALNAKLDIKPVNVSKEETTTDKKESAEDKKKEAVKDEPKESDDSVAETQSQQS